MSGRDKEEGVRSKEVVDEEGNAMERDVSARTWDPVAAISTAITPSAWDVSTRAGQQANHLGQYQGGLDVD